MVMINHVTYHLGPRGLKGIGALMELLGFIEVEPDDPFEHGYDVRWFKNASSSDLWLQHDIVRIEVRSS
jgi:hypothetical protein